MCGAVALAVAARDEPSRSGTGPAVPAARLPAPPAPIDPDDRVGDLQPRPQVARVTGAGTGEWEDTDEVGTTSDPASPSRPSSDADVRRDIAEFRRHLASANAPVGARARILPDGRAVAPANAPPVIVAVIAAANEIATKPYRWGGGHGRWRDSGYDCSGSVSFALAGAGLLNRPLDSSGFMRWAAEGAGRWMTIYSNPGHMYMVVAGLRFDTSGRGRAGTRWQYGRRPTAGYAVRHVPGL